jgi:hypothetical protein
MPAMPATLLFGVRRDCTFAITMSWHSIVLADLDIVMDVQLSSVVFDGVNGVMSWWNSRWRGNGLPVFLCIHIDFVLDSQWR